MRVAVGDYDNDGRGGIFLASVIRSAARSWWRIPSTAGIELSMGCYQTEFATLCFLGDTPDGARSLIFRRMVIRVPTLHQHCATVGARSARGQFRIGTAAIRSH